MQSRRCKRSLVLAATLAVSLPTWCWPMQANKAREIAQKTLPSIVLLVIDTGDGEHMNLGSGFFVGPDVVATNYHVVDGAVKGIAKIIGDDKEYQIEGFMGLDPERDLALVKLKGTKGQPLALGDPKSVAIGDQIYAVGNPKGLEGTFSQGIVSSIRRDDPIDLIQITAPISHGSSGGPVLDDQGRVIGVAVGSFEDGQALNFCIPASYLRPLIGKQKSLISLSSALKEYASDGSKKDKFTGVNKGNKSDSGSSTDTAGAPSGSQVPRRSSPSLSSDDVGGGSGDSIATTLGATTRLTITRADFHNRPQKSVYTMDDGIFASLAVSHRFPPSPYSSSTNHPPDDIAIKFRGQNLNITLEFTTFGIGEMMTAGHYEKCQRAAFSEGTPGIEISLGTSVASPVCGELTGEFDVYDAQFDTVKGQPRLISFAASFEQRCSSQVIKGTIYFNAVPVPGLD